VEKCLAIGICVAAELSQDTIDPCISLPVFNCVCLSGNLSDDPLVG